LQIEIVLSTAHKAKGLEFPIVILSDDFLPRADDCPLEQLPIDRYRESFNILYVAATRATKELVLNVDLFYLLYKMCRVRKLKHRKKNHFYKLLGTVL